MLRYVPLRAGRGEADVTVAARSGTPILFGALAVAAVAGSAILDALGLTFGECPFAAIIGLPCPTCFTTRAFLALGRGDVAGAFAVQPLAVSTVILLVLWGIASAAPALRTVSDRARALVRQGRRILLVALPALVALNWLYLVLHD